VAEIRGFVDSIKIGRDFGLVTIRDASGGGEHLVIWYGEESSGGPVGFWTLQLMTALSQRLPVTVGHGETSALVEAVTLRPAPP
jgi:hypothetical protein